jgi:hypothetical protein
MLMDTGDLGRQFGFAFSAAVLGLPPGRRIELLFTGQAEKHTPN